MLAACFVILSGQASFSLTENRAHLAVSGDIFSCHNWRGATGIQPGESRDTAVHPRVHLPVPHLPQKNDPTQNIGSAKVEKCYI